MKVKLDHPPPQETAWKQGMWTQNIVCNSNLEWNMCKCFAKYPMGGTRVNNPSLTPSSKNCVNSLSPSINASSPRKENDCQCSAVGRIYFLHLAVKHDWALLKMHTFSIYRPHHWTVDRWELPNMFKEVSNSHCKSISCSSLKFSNQNIQQWFTHLEVTSSIRKTRLPKAKLPWKHEKQWRH